MKKKITLVATSVLLVAAMVIGGTLAYFTAITDNVTNTFTMGKVEITLDEQDINKPNDPTARVTENNYSGVSMVPGHKFDKDPTIHVKSGSEESYIFLDMTFNKYSSLFWLMAADADADDLIELYDNNGALAPAFDNGNGVFSTTKFVEALKADSALREAIVNKWFGGIDHKVWKIEDVITGEAINGHSDKYMTIRFAYIGGENGKVNAKNSATDIDIQFMKSFGIPQSVTNEMFAAAIDVGGMQNAFNASAKAPFKMVFKAYAIQADTLDLDGAYDALFNS